MKKLSAIAAALLLTLVYFAFLINAQQVGVGGSTFHKNDITYSTEVVTPHVKWATSLPGGPIKSFFTRTEGSKAFVSGSIEGT